MFNYSPTSCRWRVGQTGPFKFGMAAGLGEGKLKSVIVQDFILLFLPETQSMSNIPSTNAGYLINISLSFYESVYTCFTYIFDQDETYFSHFFITEYLSLYCTFSPGYDSAIRFISLAFSFAPWKIVFVHGELWPMVDLDLLGFIVTV